jgi:hypothetical protein
MKNADVNNSICKELRVSCEKKFEAIKVKRVITSDDLCPGGN